MMKACTHGKKTWYSKNKKKEKGKMTPPTQKNALNNE